MQPDACTIMAFERASIVPMKQALQKMHLYLKIVLLYTFATIGLVQAAPHPAIQRAARAYKTHQYQKAIEHAERALTAKKTSPARRIEALFLISMGHFQLGAPLKSLAPMKAIWKHDPKAQLPQGASAAYKSWYQQAHKRWRAAQKPAPHPTARTVARPTSRRTRPLPPKRRRVATKARKTPPNPRRREVARVDKRTPAPAVRRRPSWFQRHGASVILLGVGGAALLAGVGAGIAFQGQHARLVALDSTASSSGEAVANAHDDAMTTGIISTTLLIAGGVTAAIGLGVLFYELRRPAAPKLPPPVRVLPPRTH